MYPSAVKIILFHISLLCLGPFWVEYQGYGLKFWPKLAHFHHFVNMHFGGVSTCFFMLVVFSFAFTFSDLDSKNFDCSDDVKMVIIHRFRFIGEGLDKVSIFKMLSKADSEKGLFRFEM